MFPQIGVTFEHAAEYVYLNVSDTHPTVGVQLTQTFCLRLGDDTRNTQDSVSWAVFNILHR
jgi:hypothetical protein